VKVDYYAYPPISAAVINRTDSSPIYSENITKIFQKKNNLRFMKKGLAYHSEGKTIYWHIDMFNESDYGRDEMILENDVGPTRIYFNIVNTNEICKRDQTNKCQSTAGPEK
jgi:hypothetical protein